MSVVVVVVVAVAVVLLFCLLARALSSKRHGARSRVRDATPTLLC